MRFTVFTPTYNRAHTLHRVHDSLAAQTFRDFEWLIVDDGSTDDTAEVVAAWARTASFPIRYVHKDNGGKHTAHNVGVREARGALFSVLDSDDALVPQALERLLWHWEQIPEGVRDGFTGVTARCIDEQGQLRGPPLAQDPLDSDSLEIFFRYKLRSEAWGFHRTEIVRAYPFPEPEGYRGVLPESVVWWRIAKKYKTRFVNEGLRIYYEGAPDQLMGLAVAKNAHKRLFHAEFLNEYIDWAPYDPVQFAKWAAQYARLSFLCGDDVATQLGRLHRKRARALWAATVVPGRLAAWNDQRRG